MHDTQNQIEESRFVKSNLSNYIETKNIFPLVNLQ